MTDITSQRPTWAEINLDNLAGNFHSVKSFVGGALKYLAVVKADAYGHGAVECSKRLDAEGVDWLGVALPEEGVELRRAGIKTPILCLGGLWDGQEDLVIDHELTPVIYQIEKATVMHGAARRRGVSVAIHVKIDTGMGRIGVRFDEVGEFAAELRTLDRLIVEGMMTHFSAADDLAQNEFTELQIERFNAALEIFRNAGFDPVLLDLANSPGAVAHPEARGNMVRLGGVLYGLGGDVLPRGIPTPDLRPVLSLHTKIAHVKKVSAGEAIGYGRTFTTERDSLIATIPIGYQDGYSRSLSNVGRAIVRGKFVPVVGRVSMDWTTLDVTGVDQVAVGDEVILIGVQNGSQITAEEVAVATSTISYEVTCRIKRLPRIYIPPS